MVQALRTEKYPANPVWIVPVETGYPYTVQTGDTWGSIAQKNSISAEELMYFNFKTYNTDEINWFLRTYVGCVQSNDHGLNWSFDGAVPGVIYIPSRRISGDTVYIKTKSGVHGIVSAHEYDDSNFYSIIGKAIDIQGLVDMNLSVWGVKLGEAEIFTIALGAVSSVVGPLAAVGSGYDGALRDLNREYFFDGFSIGLMVGINGGNFSYLKNHYAKYYPIVVPMFPEKAVTFKNIYNAGLQVGFKRAGEFNEVDKHQFYDFLKTQVSDDEVDEYWTSAQTTWSAGKQKDFLERMAHIIKLNMLANNLRLRFH